jgi:hypothetical protein
MAARPTREPLKFEAGQVVRATYEHGTPYTGVLDGERRETYHGHAWMFCGGDQAGFEDRIEILSPAPCLGDTWSNGESVARISADSHTAQFRIVSEGEPFVGDVVAVARRLWEGGYRRVNPPTRAAHEAIVKAAVERVVSEAVQKWADRGALVPAEMMPKIEWHDPCAPAASMYETTRGLDEQIGRLICGPAIQAGSAPLPRAHDVYVNANQAIEIRGDERHVYTAVLHSKTEFPIMLSGDPEIVGRMLREHGFRRIDRGSLPDAMPSFEEMLGRDPIAQAMIEDRARWDQAKREAAVEMTRIAMGNEAASLAEHVAASTLVMSDVAASSFVTDRGGNGNHLVADSMLSRVEANDAALWFVVPSRESIERARASAPRLEFIEDNAATLRAGMVVRAGTGRVTARLGRIESMGDATIVIRWMGSSGPAGYHLPLARRALAEGRWTIVDSDVRPLAALAEAVAAVFATPNRETSRRYVDIAVRGLRGESFAAAVQAVLVAACERRDRWSSAERSPFEISMLIAGAREHERQRGIVAPGVRSLNDAQLHAVCLAVAKCGRCVAWDIDLARIYERARAV